MNSKHIPITPWYPQLLIRILLAQRDLVSTRCVHVLWYMCCSHYLYCLLICPLALFLCTYLCTILFDTLTLGLLWSKWHFPRSNLWPQDIPWRSQKWICQSLKGSKESKEAYHLMGVICSTFVMIVPHKPASHLTNMIKLYLTCQTFHIQYNSQYYSLCWQIKCVCYWFLFANCNAPKMSSKHIYGAGSGVSFIMPWERLQRLLIS